MAGAPCWLSGDDSLVPTETTIITVTVLGNNAARRCTITDLLIAQAISPHAGAPLPNIRGATGGRESKTRFESQHRAGSANPSNVYQLNQPSLALVEQQCQLGLQHFYFTALTIWIVTRATWLSENGFVPHAVRFVKNVGKTCQIL